MSVQILRNLPPVLNHMKMYSSCIMYLIIVCVIINSLDEINILLQGENMFSP